MNWSSPNSLCWGWFCQDMDVPGWPHLGPPWDPPSAPAQGFCPTPVIPVPAPPGDAPGSPDSSHTASGHHKISIYLFLQMRTLQYKCCVHLLWISTPQLWKCSRPAWMGLAQTWPSERWPCPWNKMVFWVPSNTNPSVSP